MENPFMKTKTKKDMRTVADYNKKRQLEMFRFSCFNSACVIYSGSTIRSDLDIFNPNYKLPKEILNLAEALYNEAIRRDYLNLEAKK